MKLRVGTKLLGGFLLVIAIFVGAMIASTTRTRTVDSDYESLVQVNYPQAIAAEQVQADITALRSDVTGLALYGDAGDYRQVSADLRARMKTTQQLMTTPQDRQDYAKLSAAVTPELKAIQGIYDVAASGDTAQAVTLMDNSTSLRAASAAAIADTIRAHLQTADQRRSQDRRTASSTQTLQLVLALIASLVGVTIALLLSRKISRPLQAVLHAVRRVADGDLTVETVQVAGRDEVAEMSGAFNTMVDSLRDVISRTAEMGQRVAAASEELTATADQNARAVQQVAQTITDVAAGTCNPTVRVAAAARTVGDLKQAVHQIAQGSQAQSRSISNAAQQVTENSSSMQNVAANCHDVSAAATQAVASARTGGEAVKLMDGVAGVTEQNTVATEQMAASSEQVHQSFHEVGVISQQTANSAQQVSATAQEMSASTEEIAVSAQSLACMAQELQTLVSRFRLRPAA